MLARPRTLPTGFIVPCLPTKTDKLPSGSQWLHEIKHDGFRIIARKNGAQVRLYSRPGNDLTRRFPLIVETLARLRSRTCIIDGEAVAEEVHLRAYDSVDEARASLSRYIHFYNGHRPPHMPRAQARGREYWSWPPVGTSCIWSSLSPARACCRGCWLPRGARWAGVM
jgi:bifunctional non-homologous end joining protein LigD